MSPPQHKTDGAGGIDSIEKELVDAEMSFANDGSCRGQLAEALKKAYPEPPSLANFVRVKLNADLNALAGDDARYLYDRLINQIASDGHAMLLIAALQEAKPDNPHVIQFMLLYPEYKRGAKLASHLRALRQNDVHDAHKPLFQDGRPNPDDFDLNDVMEKCHGMLSNPDIKQNNVIFIPVITQELHSVAEYNFLPYLVKRIQALNHKFVTRQAGHALISANTFFNDRTEVFQLAEEMACDLGSVGGLYTLVIDAYRDTLSNMNLGYMLCSALRSHIAGADKKPDHPFIVLAVLRASDEQSDAYQNNMYTLQEDDQAIAYIPIVPGPNFLNDHAYIWIDQAVGQGWRDEWILDWKRVFCTKCSHQSSAVNRLSIPKVYKHLKALVRWIDGFTDKKIDANAKHRGITLEHYPEFKNFLTNGQ